MKMNLFISLILIISANPLFAETEDPAKLIVTSPAFEEGHLIPRAYTGEGDDISPVISWSAVPDNTKSIALICDDPDAPGGDWVHWVIFNLPGDLRTLPKGVSINENLPDGSRQGLNGSGNIGYEGPCPPYGTHRYFFKVYALDSMLVISGSATKVKLLRAMEGHIVASGELMGKYSRRSKDE